MNVGFARGKDGGRGSPLRCRRAWTRAPWAAPWMAALAATVFGGAWLVYDGVRERRVRAWLGANGYHETSYTIALHPSQVWRGTIPFEWARAVAARAERAFSDAASRWPPLSRVSAATFAVFSDPEEFGGRDALPLRLVPSAPPGGAPYVESLLIQNVSGAPLALDLAGIERFSRLYVLIGFNGATHGPRLEHYEVDWRIDAASLARLADAGARAGPDGAPSGIQYLTLPVEPLDADGIAALARIPSLVQLALPRARLRDEDVAPLVALDQLAYLYLDSAPLTDAALPVFATMPRLFFLNLSSAVDVTEDGVRALDWRSPRVTVLLPGDRRVMPSQPPIDAAESDEESPPLPSPPVPSR